MQLLATPTVSSTASAPFGVGESGADGLGREVVLLVAGDHLYRNPGPLGDRREDCVAVAFRPTRPAPMALAIARTPKGMGSSIIPSTAVTVRSSGRELMAPDRFDPPLSCVSSGAVDEGLEAGPWPPLSEDGNSIEFGVPQSS